MTKPNLAEGVRNEIFASEIQSFIFGEVIKILREYVVMKTLKQPYSFLPKSWMNANAFKEAFDYLWKRFISRAFSDGVTLSAEIVPPVVNAMFGIELYLKCLYGYENKFVGEDGKCYCEIIQTHNIKTLFDNLKEETKGKIICFLGESGISKEELFTFLKESNDDFIKWRYPQKNELNSDVRMLKGFLEVLFNISRNAINCDSDTCIYDEHSMEGYTVTMF